jgi:hypothetical protein
MYYQQEVVILIIMKFKGYHFSRSIATDAKELDIRNELVNTIEEDYALATFENIRTNCSNYK